MRTALFKFCQEWSECVNSDLLHYQVDFSDRENFMWADFNEQIKKFVQLI